LGYSLREFYWYTKEILMKKNIVRWIPLLVLVLFIAACTSPAETPPPTDIPVPADTGTEVEAEDINQDDEMGEKQEPSEVVEPTIDPQALWEENNCARCHGGNRQGSSAPPLLPETLNKEASVYIQTITDGRGRMPTFGAKMSSDEIEALVEWLMTVTP
jgi:mono/diheme cytochrome c family protein